mmetsp:Transcript_9552/g.21191  ORF Transcript_9552/g.21191 Transcript_9552/m.21191 type:complete len:132 (-) Transcript_9552:379-774(-)
MDEATFETISFLETWVFDPSLETEPPYHVPMSTVSRERYIFSKSHDSAVRSIVTEAPLPKIHLHKNTLARSSTALRKWELWGKHESTPKQDSERSGFSLNTPETERKGDPRFLKHGNTFEASPSTRHRSPP